MNNTLSLSKKVAKLKKDTSGFTANPTLDAFNEDYCSILDEIAKKDCFVGDRIKRSIKELNLAGGVSYNDHYRTAYDYYNEAVCYYELQRKGYMVNNIPEEKKATPDFKVVLSSLNEKLKKVYIEVKSLSFVGGNNRFNEIQKDALNNYISIEQQRRNGKQVCIAEQVISPLGTNSIIGEIEELNKKINNNIKREQYEYDNRDDTILLVDLSQYIFPLKKEDCLPIYPDISHKCCITGRLWMLVFGKEGERVYRLLDFEGDKCIEDKGLGLSGILECPEHDYIRGIIFTSGTTPKDKIFYGLYREKEQNRDVVDFICEVCDFTNDNQNTNGFKLYEELTRPM